MVSSWWILNNGQTHSAWLHVKTDTILIIKGLFFCHPPHSPALPDEKSPTHRVFTGCSAAWTGRACASQTVSYLDLLRPEGRSFLLHPPSATRR